MKFNIASKIRYPKLTLLAFTFVIAYFMFQEKDFLHLTGLTTSTGHLGIFIAGVFFAYGFTAAPAMAVMLILAKGQNILFAGLLGGFGAMVGDLIIFDFLRFSFADEIKLLSKEMWVRALHESLHGTVRKYLIPVLAGLIIASPLPDEIGVALLAASRHIRTRTFMAISYALNTAGIFVILYFGSLL
jgi:hypothetical protein